MTTQSPVFSDDSVPQPLLFCFDDGDLEALVTSAAGSLDTSDDHFDLQEVEFDSVNEAIEAKIKACGSMAVWSAAAAAEEEEEETAAAAAWAVWGASPPRWQRPV